MSIFSEKRIFFSYYPLWILPDIENCSWTVKIDWHINFSIFRASKKEPNPLMMKAKEILKSSRLSVPKLSFQKDHLLICSSPYLPNEWCVLIDKKGKEVEDWYEQVLQVWQNFQFPSLQLFLPKGASSESWMDFCQSKKNLSTYLKSIKIISDK